MKKFLDRLPRVITVKAPHGKRQELQTYETVARLLDATMNQHIVSMRYHSQQSKKEKDYDVHPYRLVHAQGALYLDAYVPLYKEMRIFAVERVRKLTVGEKTFDLIPELDVDPFTNSMGVHKGPACRVKLWFHPEVAATVKERTWHASQQLKARSDGSIVMTLNVSDDYALRSWILGFGRYVRVDAPASLADWLRQELEQARKQYGDGDGVPPDSDTQPGLPFLFSRIASA